MKIYWAVLLIVLEMRHQSRANGVFYVSPDNSTCEGIEKCHTLQEYADNSEAYFKNDTDIHLLFYEGNHTSNRALNISNKGQVELTSLGQRVLVNSSILTEHVDTLNMLNITLRGELKASARSITLTQGRFENSPVTLTIAKVLTIESTHFCLYGNSNNNPTILTISSPESGDLTIKNSNFMGNTAGELYAGLSLEMMGSLNITANTTSVKILDCIIMGGQSAGLYLLLLGESNLHIANSSINDNHMSGAYIVVNGSNNNILVEDTYVSNNELSDVNSGNPYSWKEPNAAGISINPTGDYSISRSSYTFKMNNVTFEGNLDRNSVPKTLFVYTSHNTTISNSNFINNHGTAVAVYLTEIFTLSGNTKFINNTGYEGGALLMFSVYLRIADHSRISFERNSVENVGGAICIRNIPIQIDRGQPCFYQLISKDPNVTLFFTNNTSEKGGSHIYGATTKTDCNTHYYQNMPLYNKQYNIFNITSSTDNSFSDVSSDPTRVCLCTGNEMECAEMESIFVDKEVHPGEKFTISATIVGADFGAVSGSIFAGTDKTSYIFDLQQAQNINSTGLCHDLEYNMHSAPHSNAQLVLSSDGSAQNGWYKDNATTERYIETYNETGEIDINLLSTPIYIRLKMLDCPPGFSYDSRFKTCNCDSSIVNTSCTFKNGGTSINRTTNLWLARKNFSDINSSICVNHYCLKSKCSDIEQVDTSNPDEQCQNKRTGKVCGRCEAGYSLTFGSAECKKCKNIYTLLIFVFILAGILLVLTIKILDLTVADGYINGFIFYCNILRVKSDFLLPPASLDKYLRVFLAWFNLDFGIKTCFFDGLDDYSFTWLQFVFPIYIWSICIVLILLSRRFNILGNNGVPVLATLFLLSYTKVLNTTINALMFTFTYEINKDGVNRTVDWARDANVGFFETKHVLLLLTALLVLIFACLPYTLALLFSRHLHRIRNSRVSRWILKFKPILDAYYGPFKNKKEYWVGVLLSVRAILLIVSSMTAGNDIVINRVLVLLLMSGLLLYKALTGPLYKSILLSLIENSLIINLIALTSFLFLSDYKRLHIGISYALVGLAFLQFLLIAIVKAFSLKPLHPIKKWLKSTRIYHKILRRRNGSADALPPNSAELQRSGYDPIETPGRSPSRSTDEDWLHEDTPRTHSYATIKLMCANS